LFFGQLFPGQLAADAPENYGIIALFAREHIARGGPWNDPTLLGIGGQSRVGLSHHSS
jgi:hypothetical protein